MFPFAPTALFGERPPFFAGQLSNGGAIVALGSAAVLVGAGILAKRPESGRYDDELGKGIRTTRW